MDPLAWGMIASVLVALISATVAIVNSIRRTPIDKQQADAAAVLSIAGVEGAYGELFENLHKEIARVKQDAKDDMNRVIVRAEDLEHRVESLQEDLATERARNWRWVMWYDNMQRRWDQLRLLDRPPAAPKH